MIAFYDFLSAFVLPLKPYFYSFPSAAHCTKQLNLLGVSAVSFLLKGMNSGSFRQLDAEEDIIGAFAHSSIGVQ